MEPQLGLSEAYLQDAVEELAVLTASTFAYYLKAHACHWNVVGPFAFPGLHSLFEEVYSDAYGAVDDLAERIRALGGLAPTGLAEMARLTMIYDLPPVPNYVDMIRELLDGAETLSRLARELFDHADADDVLDEATANLAADRMQAHEKLAWKLRSLLP